MANLKRFFKKTVSDSQIENQSIILSDKEMVA
jgi:hypothetical protein